MKNIGLQIIFINLKLMGEFPPICNVCLQKTAQRISIINNPQFILQSTFFWILFVTSSCTCLKMRKHGIAPFPGHSPVKLGATCTYMKIWAWFSHGRTMTAWMSDSPACSSVVKILYDVSWCVVQPAGEWASQVNGYYPGVGTQLWFW
jgi:hypothetical protein